MAGDLNCEYVKRSSSFLAKLRSYLKVIHDVLLWSASAFFWNFNETSVRCLVFQDVVVEDNTFINMSITELGF